jgi:bacteriocin biosynthesis cyclodehydratase domain-containing protein
MTRTDNLLLFIEGRFGHAVAERVAASVQDVAVLHLLPSLQALDDLVPRASFVGLALWRRYPSAIDAIDLACARHRIPWSSVTLEGRFLTMGPLVVPGKGACYACYRKRWSTHLAHPEREQALDDAYQADLEVGCEGFPPSGVTIAAAGLALDQAEESTSPGRVRRLDLLHCVLEETQVVRVHGCDRCSRPLSPGERYVHHLLAALRENVP